jgi:hypothetical protein
LDLMEIINRSINRALGVGYLGGDDAAAGRLGQESPYIVLIVASRSISFVYNVGSNSDVYSWALGVWALGVWALGVWALGVWALGVWALGVWALGVWAAITRRRGV